MIATLPGEWVTELGRLGQPAFRARQLFQWIHRHGVLEPAQMGNLPQAVREHLAGSGFADPLSLAENRTARDGTGKLLLRLHDGPSIETVLIRQARSERGEPIEDKPRVPSIFLTQCVSSQVGCAMGCVFCASGLAGLKRSLTAGEIVSQVLWGRRLLEAANRAEAEATAPEARERLRQRTLRSLVFMGMGEPLANYAEVTRAIRVLTDPEGIGFSFRRITVSTSGLVPELDRLAHDFGGKVMLAISLHAANDAKRSRLMPINRKYPLDELLACLKRYPLAPRARITIEYTLIAGENDSLADADELARLLRDIPVKINLIPMNPVSGIALKGSDSRHVDAFRERLASAGYTATVRKQRGDEIDAACGQLALLGAKPRIRSWARAPETESPVTSAAR